MSDEQLELKLKDYKQPEYPNLVREDIPMNKFLAKGKWALTNSELLAIIISTGTKPGKALLLAQQILATCEHSLIELSKIGVDQLKRIKGIGTNKAVVIGSFIELGRRRQFEEAKTKTKINGSAQAYQLIRSYIEDLQHEEFWVFFINRSNYVLKMEKISSGGITGTVADSRLIFGRALELKATGILLCHNHPSGSLKPSGPDIDLTKKMKSAGQALDIAVLDHLIVSSSGYYSFADEGCM